MSISAALSGAFNGFKHTNCYDSATICEADCSSELTQITLNNFSGICICKDFVKHISEVNNKATAEILRKNCDGILVEENGNKKSITFVELKSSFSSQKIFEAKQQLLASYLQFNHFLSKYSWYNPNDYEFVGIIASHSPSSDTINGISKQQILSIKQKAESKFAIDLYNNKEFTIDFENCYEILHNNLRNPIEYKKEFRIKYFCTEKSNSFISLDYSVLQN